jgi:hypothetical protein
MSERRDDDAEPDEAQSEDDGLTGEEQAALNREDDPPA